MDGLADMPIEELHLSTLYLRLLKRAGCRTVDDVVRRWPHGLLRVNGIGPFLMRVLYERMRPLAPGLLPLPMLPRPRRRRRAHAPEVRENQLRALEEERIQVLSMLSRGMTGRQIAAEYRCSSPAVYARKRRLVLHYAQPTYLERLPRALQDFVRNESKKLLMRTLGRRSTPAAHQSGALRRKRQSGAGYEGLAL
jgi:hypothetical protein